MSSVSLTCVCSKEEVCRDKDKTIPELLQKEQG